MKRYSINKLLFLISLVLYPMSLCLGASYEYDNLHRLTKVVYDDGIQITYAYDEVGNCTHMYAIDVNVDSDSDNLTDGQEVITYGTNPLNPDTDNDGMPDGWEVAHSFNPLIGDAKEDADNDGLTNVQEYQHGCNPRNVDTENDSMPDGWEVSYGLNPLVNDAKSDSDSDGYSNLFEYLRSSMPNDANSKPTPMIINVLSPAESIQQAIDSFPLPQMDGDSVVVHPGRYYENINSNGKNITLTSLDPNDPNIVEATIIDGGMGDSVVIITDGNVTLDGFTVTNGYAGNGGGIRCEDSNVTISNCEIIQNETWYGGNGGGIFCNSGRIQISNCKVENNTTGEGFPGGSGGGIYCSSSTIATIVNSDIMNNRTGDGSEAYFDYSTEIEAGDGGNGAGIFCSSGTITNCIITGNITGNGGICDPWPDDVWPYPVDGGNGGSGGGIYCSSATITNCTIANNGCGYGGFPGCDIDGFCGWGGEEGMGTGICSDASSILTNTIVWNDSLSGPFEDIAYCDIRDGIYPGTGNISIDPFFADMGSNDYHLKSEFGRWDPNSQLWTYDGVTSPCIDAGDPNSDWTKELWPHGKRINMGAYGGTAEASMSLSDSGNVANLNNDPGDAVTEDDLLRFIEDWCLKSAPLSGDLNRDSAVDFSDFAIFASHWLEGIYH